MFCAVCKVKLDKGDLVSKCFNILSITGAFDGDKGLNNSIARGQKFNYAEDSFIHNYCLTNLYAGIRIEESHSGGIDGQQLIGKGIIGVEQADNSGGIR